MMKNFHVSNSELAQWLNCERVWRSERVSSRDMRKCVSTVTYHCLTMLWLWLCFSFCCFLFSSFLTFGWPTDCSLNVQQKNQTTKKCTTTTISDRKMHDRIRVVISVSRSHDQSMTSAMSSHSTLKWSLSRLECHSFFKNVKCELAQTIGSRLCCTVATKIEENHCPTIKTFCNRWLGSLGGHFSSTPHTVNHATFRPQVFPLDRFVLNPPKTARVRKSAVARRKILQDVQQIGSCRTRSLCRRNPIPINQSKYKFKNQITSPTHPQQKQQKQQQYTQHTVATT